MRAGGSRGAGTDGLLISASLFKSCLIFLTLMRAGLPLLVFGSVEGPPFLVYRRRGGSAVGGGSKATPGRNRRPGRERAVNKPDSFANEIIDDVEEETDNCRDDEADDDDKRRLARAKGSGAS